jgi:hypothetical protein
VKGLLALGRISVRTVANATGYNETYVGRVLNGELPASPRFRAALAELIGLSEQELFHEDVRRERRSPYPGDRGLRVDPHRVNDTKRDPAGGPGRAQAAKGCRRGRE